LPIYQRDPDKRPDSDYESGELRHLVVGNRGRLLDPRRTPVKIVALDTATAQFTIEITAFEDTGARWVVPFDGVVSYQFENGSPAANAAEVAEFGRVAERFKEPLVISPDPDDRIATEKRLLEERSRTGEWLAANSHFLTTGGMLPSPDTREGHPLLFKDLRAYMEEHDLWEIENRIATQYVSNPYSGEVIKGHCIVLAELGLAPFDGTVIRDPGTFSGRWSKERRGEHILGRLAFIREVLSRSGHERVLLYRGYADDGGGPPRRTPTYLSASFNREVSAELAHSGGTEAKPVLMIQETPIERLFMTYLETAQMNRQFKEAEAVLLYDAGSLEF
jgi:hypothetical protein